MFDQLGIVFEKGGVLMLPLSFLAILIYTEGIGVWWMLQKLIAMLNKRDGKKKLGYEQWLAHSLKKGIVTDINSSKALTQLREYTEKKYERRLIMLARFIKAAPLLGLLGTVMGMFETFEGLLLTGLAQSEDMASGISQALITTQYGLLIAIPGLILLTAAKAKLQLLKIVILRINKSENYIYKPSVAEMDKKPFSTVKAMMP
jgi:biopolymer transport protein ExbB